MDPIVFDLGTGLRFWGEDLPHDGSFRGTALVTHLHWDHVQGLPFFTPINRAGAELDVYAPPPEPGCSVAAAFDDFMRPPYFPVRSTDLFGTIRFHDASDTDLAIGRAKVRVRSVPHVGATNGYRVELDGYSVAYVSDHQQPCDGSSRIAGSVLELCGGADLLIHDAQYDSGEFAEKTEWGHCTVDYAVNVAVEAGAKRLALFHHDPAHDDDRVDELLGYARGLVPSGHELEVLAAGEGMSVVLAAPVTIA
ncbi:MAG TPA: MBL fold metallo-hydrolase [Acidimicrobiales bacterium]|jgi:phosphoribosyl 1,2-cyclic phosphodiesterase|nr:MBL fold metallo-hydrolase [Acidimicrobiales bacterium]